MIDEKRLLDSIEYSNKWNNKPCPGWVIKLIKAQPTLPEMDAYHSVRISMDYSWIIRKMKSGWAYIERKTKWEK